eukprot:687305_1
MAQNTSQTSQKPKENLSVQDFEIGKKLNSGKFARVYLARKRNTDFLVALKVTQKRGIVENGMAGYLHSEVQILSNLRHPNIIRYYGLYHDENTVTLILEYCAGGELWDLLAEKGRFKEETVTKYILQLTSALQYIHNKNVIHRDIKPENLLLDCWDNLKLCDFGWSVHCSSNKERRETFCGNLNSILLLSNVVESTNVANRYKYARTA